MKIAVVKPASATPKLTESCCIVLAIELALLACFFFICVGINQGVHACVLERSEPAIAECQKQYPDNWRSYPNLRECRQESSDNGCVGEQNCSVPKCSEGELSAKEAAGLLEVPVGTVKARLHRARVKLIRYTQKMLRHQWRVYPVKTRYVGKPRLEWIEIPVPALISEETFALAQEQLEKNKQFASRRTRRPTLLQGMLACQQCGYALYSVSGGNGTHRNYYYRCIGSQSFRNFAGPLCQNRAIRQEHLDDIIWREIVHLLQDPALIEHEIERRMQEARQADPVRQREQYLEREQARLHSRVDRLLTAYQEELLTLEQLRERMPELQKQKHAVESELQSLRTAAQDQSRCLRLLDTLNDFRARLLGNADRMDLMARRKIIRLLVKEILVGTDTIIIRHSIPLANSPSRPPDSTPQAAVDSGGKYRLCTRRGFEEARKRLVEQIAGTPIAGFLTEQENVVLGKFSQPVPVGWRKGFYCHMDLFRCGGSLLRYVSGCLFTHLAGALTPSSSVNAPFVFCWE